MHGNDTEKQIFFYGPEFYVLSNFSSFQIEWKGKLWPTSEHVYQSEKFEDDELKEGVRNTRSAHEALKFARDNGDKIRKNWQNINLDVMKKIMHAKVNQHPYVKKKLLESGNRKLVEDSWRDDFWGWGPNKDGENHLGKLWMEVRDELRKTQS